MDPQFEEQKRTEHDLKRKLLERHRQREMDKQEGKRERVNDDDAGPAVLDQVSSKRIKNEPGVDAVLNCVELRGLLIQRVVQQERAIVAIEGDVKATAGTATEKHSKDRTEAYDAILRSHQTEMHTLRDKLQEAHRARLEKHDCSKVDLDLASYQVIVDLKRQIHDAETRTSEAHKTMLALPFDPENTGKLIVHRQRSLRAENKELERQAVTGRHGQLKCEIALFRKHNLEIKAELERMEVYCEQIDTEIAEMQKKLLALKAKREGKEGASAASITPANEDNGQQDPQQVPLN